MYRREEILAQSSSYRRPKIFMHMPRRFRHQCQCWFWAFLVTGPTQHPCPHRVGINLHRGCGRRCHWCRCCAPWGRRRGTLNSNHRHPVWCWPQACWESLARGEPAYHACWLYPLVGIRVFRLFVSSDASLRSWPLAQSLVVTWAGNSSESSLPQYSCRFSQSYSLPRLSRCGGMRRFPTRRTS